ncbi:MAG: hypothetical protein SWK76_15890 [Actinomycetota bacterium]|nr:hypothetical protein [Actinomycetota bacterium]
MCREGVDLVTLKVALKHSADRLRQEGDHLRQWSALSANVNLEDISSRLREALEKIAAGEELLRESVHILAEMQVQAPTSTGQGATITPM